MSSNPLLKKYASNDYIKVDTLDENKIMTTQGTIAKTALLLGIVVLVAYYAWTLCASGYADKAQMFLIGGAIAGLVLAIITSFKPDASPITAPAYAACEGLVVGVASYAYGQAFGGIIFNAIGITILTLFTMLFLYTTGVIKATPTFKKVVLTSTVAVFIFYLIGFIGALLGHPMTVFNGGTAGIIISLLICGVAASNFIIDFDFIEQGAKNALPKYFEWYGGFALLVTLIWLYLEVLRLLAQLNSRD